MVRGYLSREVLMGRPHAKHSVGRENRLQAILGRPVGCMMYGCGG